MPQKKKVIQTKLHNAAKSMSTSQRNQLTGKTSKDALSEIQRIEKRQEEIDTYNFETCQNIDPYFNSIQLAGSSMIIRLHKENYIKGIEMLLANGQPVYDHWISQVDGRMRQTDRPKWVDNPLPYVFSGVIVAMSASAKAHFAKEKKMLTDIDATLGEEYRMPQVGDIVNMEHFMFADSRYYKNKQSRDFIKNPEEYSITKWEGYVTVHPTRIESIVLDKEEFQMTSPYRAFKEGKLDLNSFALEGAEA